MREHWVELFSPAIGTAGSVVRYGHYGRPVLVFPSEQGRASDFAGNGMVDAVADLIDAGRVKLFCVDSYDAASWAARDLPLEERARRHGAFESWIVDQVVPFIARGLRRRRGRHRHWPAARWAPSTRSTSPASGPTCSRWRCASPATTTRRPGTAGASAATRAYFNSPADYLANLNGDHLDWLRTRLSVLLVCGQGQWEDTTGAARLDPAHGRTARRQGDPARARPVGLRRAARLAVVARAMGASPAAILLTGEAPRGRRRTPHRTAAGHRGRLAARLRGR